MITPAPKTKLLLFVLSFLFCSIMQPVVTARAVQQKKDYQRIISLYSAHTENICHLGAGDRLIGISPADDFPQYILDKKRYSYREDPERFIAAQPDLVLIRPMIERSYPEFVKKLRAAGIDVVSIQPDSVDEMFSYWRELASLIGKEKNAEQMITAFKEQIARIQKEITQSKQHRLTRPRVYFQSIHSKSKTFAPTSIGAFVLQQAGGNNAAADARQVRKTNIAFYPKEKLLAQGESIDFFIAQVGRMNPVTLDIITREPGYKAIKAVRLKRILLVEEALVSRPTFRLIEGIEKIHKFIYRDT